ncbi:Uncharacterized conserved protein YndB, AHSA1/START domain [Actinacidiphila yanglinensis]|uniref:Uncharacterized conserved protein YndB, AHSA1/START domain n=1 Tax=Actinacidiphila yanglinensis TaxID=310779 RepID=A0A1H6CTK7_9ACTN|nr:SRPBCC domain-containing protein [Actinacidiphila yanglinensis]SEG76399.1 Uncharacterized conserved protein YndB, AHSA1/START domain [Actinacidiphila yanglinensis]
MYTTRVTGHVNAPRAAVYAALVDADAIAKWRAPEGMSTQVHVFEPREGGAFRISLTYDAPTGVGKSEARTDTYHGRFVRLVPGEEVVEEIEFETQDPRFGGLMTVTTTLTDAAADEAAAPGTDVLIVHEGVPDSVPPADNETGTRMSLAHLAALVEAGRR